MIQDASLMFSKSQAITADAASTDVIDLGQALRDLGNGELMDIVVNVEVALAGTTPTFNVQLQQDSASGMGSAETILQSQTFSALPAGSQVVLRIPPGAVTKRYLRLYYDVGGTSPTITVSAGFVAGQAGLWRAYAGVI